MGRGGKECAVGGLGGELLEHKPSLVISIPVATVT